MKARASIPCEDISIDDGPGGDVQIGLLVAFMFFVVFLGWSAFLPLDSAAYGAGAVVVSGNRKAVQHPYGGVVSALHVVEGAVVQRGQVLMELSSGELKATERSLTSQSVALYAQRARLAAERDQLQTIPVPKEFATLTPNDRRLAEEALRLQQQEVDARSAGFLAQRDVIIARERQLNQQIAGFREQIVSNARQQTLVAEELRGVRDLAARGYAPQTRVRALERSVEDLSGQQGGLRSEIARTAEAIGETRLQIVALGAERAETNSEQIRQAEVQINDLQPRLLAARDQLEKTLVRAPAAGQVVGLTIFTVGGVAPASQTLMEIVPFAAPLQVQARVRPDDADDVRIGQQAEVRFMSLHQRDLPRLTGKVALLSADSFLDERTGDKYFNLVVDLPSDQLALLRATPDFRGTLRPGLPVQVIIPLRRRTALQYLLDPLSSTLWRSFREH